MADKPNLVPVDPDIAETTFGPLEKYRAPDGVQNTVGLKLDYGKPRTDLITWEGFDSLSAGRLQVVADEYEKGPADMALTAADVLSVWWEPKSSSEKGPMLLERAAVYTLFALQHFVTGGHPLRKHGNVYGLHASLSPALLSVGEVLAYGAKKYSARNWENGIMYSRVYGAATRHLMAFLSGEAMDPETRLPHLAHAACCLMFLLTFEARGQGGKLDDRPFVKNGEATS